MEDSDIVSGGLRWLGLELGWSGLDWVFGFREGGFGMKIEILWGAVEWVGTGEWGMSSCWWWSGTM